MILIQILHEIPVNCHNATFQSWGKQVTTTYICIVFVRLALQCPLSGVVTLLSIEIGYALLTNGMYSPNYLHSCSWLLCIFFQASD